jgi:hypothetical protein
MNGRRDTELVEAHAATPRRAALKAIDIGNQPMSGGEARAATASQ